MGDGSAYNVMIGIGETYLPAFVLAMGMGERISGLISTVPLFVGALLQMASPWGVRMLGSHRRWVAGCAVVQATTFVPLILGAIVGWMPVWLAFVVASLYWATSMGCGAAWNTWMGGVVPARLRANFFSRRSRAAQIAILAGFMSGGVLLQLAAPHGYLLWAFVLLFTTAAVCRYISARFLFAISEPEPPDANHTRLPLWAVLRGHPNARLLVFLLFMQVCVQIMAPYFTPYMLEHLRFSYWEYASVIGIQFVSRTWALPHLGRAARRWGADRLLWAMAVGVVPLSALWLISSNFYYLMTVQLIGGIFWVGYELAFLLLFFETIPARERTSLLTNYNLLNAAAILLGSLAGNAILSAWSLSVEGYQFLLGLSAVLRGVVVVSLLWIPLARGKLVPQALIMRSTGVRAADSPLDEPVLPSIDNRDE
jgi:MFS family permease